MAADRKQIHRVAVLTELLAAGRTTRSSLAELAALSNATVTRAVDSLVDEGLVREHSVERIGGRGRPATLLEVAADRELVVGVDLGAANTRLVLADLVATPLTIERTQTPADLDAVELGGWLSDWIGTHAGTAWPHVTGIAIGLPGAVNQTHGQVSNAPHLAQVEDPKFLATVSERLGRPIEIDNDANYALLGERHFGAARETNNVAMLTLGAGLGAGVAIDGQLVTGTNGLIGEFGSLPIGPMGSRLEHMVTGPGIMLRASELGLQLDTPADLFVPTTDERVKHLRNQFEQSLTVALTAAVVTCDPEMIVLGGGIARSLGESLGRLVAALEDNLRTAPQLVIAELGDLSGSLGAAVRALHHRYLALGISAADLSRVPPQRSFRDEAAAAATA